MVRTVFKNTKLEGGYHSGVNLAPCSLLPSPFCRLLLPLIRLVSGCCASRRSSVVVIVFSFRCETLCQSTHHGTEPDDIQAVEGQVGNSVKERKSFGELRVSGPQGTWRAKGEKGISANTQKRGGKAAEEERRKTGREEEEERTRKRGRGGKDKWWTYWKKRKKSKNRSRGEQRRKQKPVWCHLQAVLQSQSSQPAVTTTIH